MRLLTKQRLVSLGLFLSLTFNVAVVVGFMLGGGGPRRPQPMRPPLDLDRAARILDLTEEQRTKLAEIKTDRDRIFPAIDEEAQLLEHDLHEELAKDQADSATVRQILERQAQLSGERRTAQADLFERFQQVLTPEQNRRLHDEFSKRPPREGPPLEVVRRFDADGDGRLNDAERVAAEKELKARRNPRGPRGPRGESPPEFGNGLPPIWPFFDHDEDGTLNAAERAERDEFLRTHRPSRAFRPELRPGGPTNGERP